jgi:predicted permease
LVVAFAAGRLLVAGLSTETAAVLGDLVAFRADGPVLALMAGVSITAGIAFGAAPAWRATMPDLERSLREGGRLGGAHAGSWLRRAFVVSQFVLTLLLAVLAGQFGRSLRNLRQDDLGFARTNALIAFVDPRATPYQDRSLVPLYDAILARASALPGVQVASVSSYAPILGGAMLRNSITVPGHEALPGESLPQFDYVSSGFFSTVGLRFVSGRSFTENEGHRATRVAVVNQTFARRYFGGADAVSRQFRFPEDVTIVGVVADARFNGPGSTVEPMVFVPYAQWPGDWTYLVVMAQTEGDPEANARPMKRVLDELAPGIRVRNLTTLREQLDRSLERQRLAAGVAALFGLLGLGLAAVGLYGVVAYLVTARTGEFGIRLALGAHPRALFWLVLRESLALAGLGIAIGLPLALAGGRLVSAQLFGVGAADPLITGGAILTLSIVAIASSMVPAGRASRVDPIQALRSE